MDKETEDISKIVNKELNNKKDNIAILKSVNLKEIYSRKCPYTCDCAWESPCEKHELPICGCTEYIPYQGCGMR